VHKNAPLPAFLAAEVNHPAVTQPQPLTHYFKHCPPVTVNFDLRPWPPNTT